MKNKELRFRTDPMLIMAWAAAARSEGLDRLPPKIVGSGPKQDASLAGRLIVEVMAGRLPPPGARFTPKAPPAPWTPPPGFNPDAALTAPFASLAGSMVNDDDAGDLDEDLDPNDQGEEGEEMGEVGEMEGGGIHGGDAEDVFEASSTLPPRVQPPSPPPTPPAPTAPKSFTSKPLSAPPTQPSKMEVAAAEALVTWWRETKSDEDPGTLWAGGRLLVVTPRIMALAKHLAAV